VLPDDGTEADPVGLARELGDDELDWILTAARGGG
jgi:hypothetical protein